MLHTIHVQNLALLERAEIRLAEGLTVVSGETGGGKSLLITALALLRGEKASGALVRHGADELQVDGEFRLGGGDRSAAVAALVQRACGVAIEDDLLLVTRIVDRQGRTRVRIGGRPATLAALRELGALLLEIHGQGDARALMRPETQCETLDAFAGTTALRREFAQALAAARASRTRLRELADGERERRQRREFLRFQQQAMVDLRLQDGELQALEQEHHVLGNLDALRQRLDAALGALQENDDSAAGQLGRALRALRDAAAIDRRLEDAAEQLAQAEDLVTGVCRELQSGQARLDLDPARLQAVQERLDELHAALKRFGPTEADLRDNLARTTGELQRLDEDADTDALAAELARATEAAAALGRKLLRARGKAAKPFADAIEAELKDLGMAHTAVRVAMANEFAAERLLDDATEHGPAAVDLEVRINPGEPFHSMSATASGGELARIVLAVKKTLADQDRVPLLVFDEIDAEIGGRLGLQVGKKLHEVARHHQVVIVTHLAPVAAFAQHHLLVNKQVTGGGRGDERTRSQVQLLRGAEIEKELAAMAIGDGADATALQQARRLVAKAKESAGGA